MNILGILCAKLLPFLLDVELHIFCLFSYGMDKDDFLFLIGEHSL